MNTSPLPPSQKRSFHLNSISFFQKFQKDESKSLSGTLDSPLKIQLEKSDAVVIKSKWSKGTLLYRLFHSEDEASDNSDCPSKLKSPGNTSNTDSDDSDSSVLHTTGSKSQAQRVNAQKPLEMSRKVTSKESKPNETKKELPFLFRHLKANRAAQSPAPLGLNENKSTSSLENTSRNDAHTPKVLAESSAITLVAPECKTERSSSSGSLCEKYGWIEKGCVGKGSNGVVRVSHKSDPKCPNVEKLYAIKVKDTLYFY